MSTARVMTLVVAGVPWLFGVPFALGTARLARRRLICPIGVAVVVAQLALTAAWSAMLVLDIGSWPVRTAAPAGVLVLGIGYAIGSWWLRVSARRSPLAEDC